VLASLTRFLREKLKLTVDPKKSALDRPWKRKFLGFSLTSQKVSRVRVAPQSVERFKDRERARASAFNGRGPWWNAGASHMNAALPTSYFRKLGLISLMEEVTWQTLLRMERP